MQATDKTTHGRRRAVALTGAEVVTRLSRFDQGGFRAMYPTQTASDLRFNPDPPEGRKPWFKTNGFKLVGSLALASGILAAGQQALDRGISAGVVEHTVPLHVVEAATSVAPNTAKAPFASLFSDRAPVTQVIRAEAPFVLPAFDISQMRPSAAIVEEIKKVELLRLTAYQDLGDQGIWTIGYGHTGFMPDGSPIKKGAKITEAEAEALLALDVERHAQDVREAVKAPVTQAMFDSLVNFHFNTGAIHNASLTQRLNKGNYLAAAEQFLEWIYVTRIDATGQKTKEPHPGLTLRAQFNHDLFITGLSDALKDALTEKTGPEYKVALARKSANHSAKRLISLPLLGAITGSGAHRAIARVMDRVQTHSQALTELANAQTAMLDTLDAQRLDLLTKLRAHPAPKQFGATGEQIENLQRMMHQLHVTNFVANTYRAERINTTKALEYYKRSQEQLSDVLLAGQRLAKLAKHPDEVIDSDMILDHSLRALAKLEVYQDYVSAYASFEGSAKAVLPAKSLDSIQKSMNATIDIFQDRLYASGKRNVALNTQQF